MNIKNKKIIPYLIVALIILAVAIFVFWKLSAQKKIEIIWPLGGEDLIASQTYKIQWKSKNIGNIGILLVKGEDQSETKWIVQDFPGRTGEYDWPIFVWETTGQDYKIAILEYPWEEEKTISYSNSFSIIGPQFASCDEVSINQEWPFVPSDFPDQKRVFITTASFKGNLDGLNGADKKCQVEAENRKLTGTWQAFLGDDSVLAIERLNLEGIFVEAKSSADLPEGKTCHRLLGKNFNEFFKKLSLPLNLTQDIMFEKSFLSDLGKIWLGRINDKSQKSCLVIMVGRPIYDQGQGYSFTATCQNWTTDRETVAGYPTQPGQENNFPICYTPAGSSLSAVGVAGLSSGLIKEGDSDVLKTSIGRFCSVAQKLLCIEQ